MSEKKLSVEEICKLLPSYDCEELGRIVDTAMEVRKKKLNEKSSSSGLFGQPYFGNRTDYGNKTIGICFKGTPDHASYVQSVNVRIRIQTPFSTIFQKYYERTKVTQGSLAFYLEKGKKLILKMDSPQSLGMIDGDVVLVKFARLH